MKKLKTGRRKPWFGGGKGRSSFKKVNHVCGGSQGKLYAISEVGVIFRGDGDNRRKSKQMEGGNRTRKGEIQRRQKKQPIKLYSAEIP